MTREIHRTIELDLHYLIPIVNEKKKDRIQIKLINSIDEMKEVHHSISR